MADSELRIAVTANLTALQTAMEEASKLVGKTVGDVRAIAATLPAATQAAAGQAGAALASFTPQIQAQSARILDLKTAYSQVSASIKETEAMVKEAGGAQQVGASIIQEYSREQVAQRLIQNELNAAIARYRDLLNEAYAAQVRLASAPTVAAGAAGVAGVAAVEAGAIAAGEAAGAAARPAEGGGVPPEEQTIVAAEALTAAREAETAATEAEALATERATAAAAGEAVSEERLSATILAGTTARNAELAADERGALALKEHAAATAALQALEASLAGTTARTAEQEAALEAARNRQTAALAAMRARQVELTAARNADATAAMGQASITNQVTSAQMRAAEAVIAHKAAQAELAAAEELAGMTGREDTAAMTALAAANARATATSLELAAANKAVAAEFEGAGSAVSLFRQRLIIGENGIRAFVTTGLTSIPLLIAAIVAGFAVRAIEAMREFELEMANLSRLTGESITYLASMGEAAEAAGAKSDDLTQSFRRLDRTISDAASGSEQARLALREMGVDMSLINAGVLPKTSTVLAQISDYLHTNAGNAEVMRAAMRALGVDSVALAGFLAQGSQEVRRQAETFAGYGTAVAGAEAHTKSLSMELAKAGAVWKGIKILILEAADEVAIWGTKSLEAIGETITWPIEALVKSYQDLRDILPGVTKANADFMAQAMKQGPLAAPAPPQFALTKPVKEKAAPFVSEMGQFREELAAQEAAFDGSRAAMLRMEVMFWDQIVETGRAKGKDAIAVQTELSRTILELRREENSDQLAAIRDLAGLARSGSADRIALEQRVADTARALYGTDSKEYEKSQEQLLLAKRAAFEETIRLDVEEFNRQASLHKESDVRRVEAYDRELVYLRGYLAIAEAAEKSSSEVEQIIARDEAASITEQIKRVAIEREKAKRAATAATEAGLAGEVSKGTERSIKLIQEQEKLQETYFSTDKARIDDLASHDLISKSTKIRMLDAVAESEYKISLAAMVAEKAELEAEQGQIKAIAGQEAKYEELASKIEDLDNKIAISAVKRNQQIITSTQKLHDEQLKLFTSVFDSIESGFQKTVDGMIQGTLTFSQGMARAGAAVVISLTNDLVKMLLEWTKHEAAKLMISRTAATQQQTMRAVAAVQQTTIETTQTAVHATQETAKAGATVAGQAVQTAAATTGAATRTNVGIIEDLKSIGRAAATAAAHAFKWVMEEVPFPVNVALAPAAAAAAFAGVLVFQGLASAAGGADVAHDMVMQVHKNEMVLPANISAGIRAMVSGEGTAAGPVGAARKGGGDTTFNFPTHIGSMSALDGASMRAMLEEHGDLVGAIAVAAVKRHFRTNGVGG